MYGKKILGKGLMVLLLVLVLVVPAMAETQGKTLEDYNNLDSRIAELEKQVKIAELERELSESKDEMMGLTLPPAPMSASMQTTEAKPAVKREMPMVNSIYGSQGHLSALLQWKDGSKRILNVGDGVAAGTRVALITANRVVVQHAGAGSEDLAFVPRVVKQESRR